MHDPGAHDVAGSVKCGSCKQFELLAQSAFPQLSCQLMECSGGVHAVPREHTRGHFFVTTIRLDWLQGVGVLALQGVCAGGVCWWIAEPIDR